MKFHGGPRNARQVEQVFNQLPHPAGGRAYPPKQPAPLFVHKRTVVLQESLTVSADASEGGTKIVADGVSKTLQLLVGCLELRCPLPNPFLKLSIQISNLGFCGFPR